MKEIIDFIYDRVEGHIGGTLSKAEYKIQGDMLSWVSKNGSYRRELRIDGGIIKITLRRYLTGREEEVLSVNIADPDAIEKAVLAFMDMAITI